MVAIRLRHQVEAMPVVDAVLAGGLGQHHRQRGGNVEDVGRLHAVHGLRDAVAVEGRHTPAIDAALAYRR